MNAVNVSGRQPEPAGMIIWLSVTTVGPLECGFWIALHTQGQYH